MFLAVAVMKKRHGGGLHNNNLYRWNDVTHSHDPPPPSPRTPMEEGRRPETMHECWSGIKAATSEKRWRSSRGPGFVKVSARRRFAFFPDPSSPSTSTPGPQTGPFTLHRNRKTHTGQGQIITQVSSPRDLELFARKGCSHAVVWLLFLLSMARLRVRGVGS